MVSVSSTPSCVLWTDRNVDADAGRWRILVVDDNAASAEGLAAALSADGCDARYVLSGVDALQAIDGWVPHIVVLDISMPEHDGFATARVLRRISPPGTPGSLPLRRSARITCARKASTQGSTAIARRATRPVSWSA